MGRCVQGSGPDGRQGLGLSVCLVLCYHGCVIYQVFLACVCVRKRFISAQEWFVRSPKNRCCDGSDFDAVTLRVLFLCMCVSMSTVFVRAVLCASSLEHIRCTCCLIHRLNKQATLMKCTHTHTHRHTDVRTQINLHKQRGVQR